MSATAYHSSVITKAGTVRKRARVPESCIESCETILRWAANPSYSFTGGGQGSSKDAPPMFLLLMRGHSVVKINVSDNTSAQTFKACRGLASFIGEDAPLKDVLKIGLGVSLINVGAKDNDGYNMHFLAAVIIASDGVTFSDVSEPDDWDQISQTVVSVVKAATIRDLRAELGDPYTDAATYAAGVVSL
jgi:hypothetical protein